MQNEEPDLEPEPDAQDLLSGQNVVHQYGKSHLPFVGTTEAETLHKTLEFTVEKPSPPLSSGRIYQFQNYDFHQIVFPDQDTCSICTCRSSVCDVATITDTYESPLTHDVMEEIEDERRLCKREQIKVERLKTQLEQEQREFRKEKKELLRQLELERETMNQKAEEERRKLGKDRMVFER